MVYMLGLVVTMLVWLVKGNGSMKDSYTSGKEDFLNIIKGESNDNIK